jgi:hypothetical protein
MLELVDAGWQLGEFSSATPAVRCRRGAEQRMLSIESGDPEQRDTPRTWGGQCINCED